MFRNIWYTMAVRVCWLHARLCCRIEIEGAENIPAEGAVLLTANHISYFDPFLIARHVPRCVHFMAKEELFATKIGAFVMRRWHTIPVKRNSADKRALSEAIDLLKQGEIVGLFPQGGINTDSSDKSYQAGVAMLAMNARAAILPVQIEGSRALYRLPLRKRQVLRIRYNPVWPVEQMLGATEPKTGHRDKKAVRNRIMELVGQQISTNAH